MAGPSAAGGADGFRFRRLEKPEEFRHAEELQQAALGADPSGVVPAPVLRAFQDHGGLVLGAFADIYLAGVTVSTIGWDGSALYHYVHLAAVRPEYRNHRLGLRLMAYLRDEVLRLGLSDVRWTFDPLVARNAGLSVRRLGAVPERYLPHYFGRPPDPSAADPESDRLRVRWALADDRVAARVAGTLPDRADDLRRWEAAEPVVETETGEQGLRRPTAVAEPGAPTAHLEIPFDLDLIREHEPTGLRRWRHAVRDAFRAVFDAGYRVDDFAVLSVEHERRAFYLLARGAPAAPGPSSPR